MLECKICHRQVTDKDEATCYMCYAPCHYSCSKPNDLQPLPATNNEALSCFVCYDNDLLPSATFRPDTPEDGEESGEDNGSVVEEMQDSDSELSSDSETSPSTSQERILIEAKELDAPRVFTLRDFYYYHKKASSDETDKQRASCAICHPTVSTTDVVPRFSTYVVSNGSTKSMKYHLWRQHPEQYDLLQKPRKYSPKKTVKIRGLKSIVRRDDLIDQLMLWIIRTNQPFTVVDDPIFQNILEGYARRLTGSSADKSFPCNKFFRTKLIATYQEFEDSKMTILRKVDSKISITTDIWTSPNAKSFIGFTSHWIDSTFTMKKLLLAFVPIPERHTAANIYTKFCEVVAKYELSNKIATITLDNAKTNNRFIDSLGDTKESGPSFLISVRTFIYDASPTCSI